MMEYLKPRAGANIMTTSAANPKMGVNCSLVRTAQRETAEIYLADQECLLLLQSGKLKFQTPESTGEIERGDVFDHAPAGLHVPAATRIAVEALEDSEYLLVSILNTTPFPAAIFSPENVPVVQRGAGLWNDAACREVRTMCDYSLNPKSMLAFGETVNYPGRWSGFIPHYHHQPELYFYRFNKPQGFGAAFYGENLYMARDYAFLTIEEPLAHPQTAAPGYAMYYFWVIRHFPGDPWLKPIDIEEHKWLLDPEAKIWPDK